MTSGNHANVAECETADVLVRPSTVRRRANLQQIISTFSASRFDAVAVAALLQCSLSAAYQYIDMLVDACVIKLCRDSNDSGGNLRKGYRMNSDPLYAVQFLMRLRESAAIRSPGQRQVILRDESGRERPVGQVSVAIESRGEVRPVSPATRDPLVAALFGAKGGEASIGNGVASEARPGRFGPLPHRTDAGDEIQPHVVSSHSGGTRQHRRDRAGAGDLNMLAWLQRGSDWKPRGTALPPVSSNALSGERDE
jgi:hypothetical protein